MSTTTRRGRGPAALEALHPLGTREKRTVVNYALRDKGIPAKACSVCWVIKSTAEFNRKSSASDGLAPDCRPCCNAKHAARMANDPEYRERFREMGRKSARKLYPIKRELIREQIKRRRIGYKAMNASRVQDPNVFKRCAGQCGQLLPETAFRLDRGAKGGLRNRCGHCSDASRRARRACLGTYGDPVGWECYLCGDRIETKSVAWVDHLVPQSQAGPDTADNVRWTHDMCNIRRQDRPLTAVQLQRALTSGPVPYLLQYQFMGEPS